VSSLLQRHAGTAALVGAFFWIVSAATGTIGQGNLFTTWTDGNYLIWNTVTAIALLCSLVALIGTALWSGAGRDTVAIAALVVGVIGSVLMIMATWAWGVVALPIAIAAAYVVQRLKSAGVAESLSWALVAAWPVGSTLWYLGNLMQWGPRVSDEGSESAAVISFAVAAVLFAAGLATLGRWLRTQATDQPFSAPG
jgi:hypothetical protein